MAVSEPGGGSGVAALRTTARTDGDDDVVDGTTMGIANGLQADGCCLLATPGTGTGDGAAHRNNSLIVVPLDPPGITKQKIRKIGMDSSDTAPLFFDGVRVPRRHRIGEEGQGFAYPMVMLRILCKLAGTLPSDAR